VAERSRQLVEKEFGSYRSHKEAIANPEAYGPDVVARARRLGSLSLQLQWVLGSAVKAEDSFIRINQQAAIIMPQELELIKSRRRPNTIAARAIIRQGTGHQYWSSFGEKEQADIKRISKEIYQMVFEPILAYPIKSLDLPAGGSVYAGPTLRMIYDFVTLCVGVPSPEADDRGVRTVEYLDRCRRVMELLLSNRPSSLGLHPAVFFYSWTGKQQPILFLTIAELMVDFERRKKLPEFTRLRGAFEEFLISSRPLLNQVIRKFGTKGSGRSHLFGFYREVLELLGQGIPVGDLAEHLRRQPNYSYLQPDESPYSTRRQH
jgi:hypothetical protein